MYFLYFLRIKFSKTGKYHYKYFENTFRDETNDMIETQFTGIMQDVTVYYTKKLDMYRIKMEHHQRTRPDRQHYELASILIQAYEEHPNRQVSI